MPARVLILTGAPESTKLDWTTNLLSSFQPSIAQFTLLQSAPLQPPTLSLPHHGDVSRLDLAVWRSLPLERAHIRTGFSQQHDLDFIGAFPSSVDFLTTASISCDAASQQGLTQHEADEESTKLLTEFYDHSLAVHQDLASSQLVPHVSQQQKPASPSRTSFMSDSYSNSRSFASDDGDGTTVLLDQDDTTTFKAPLKSAWGRATDHLSDLEDIPTASYLLSIIPQTMTVTLIVGIISIAAPRTVETRYATTKTLVEVLVGDDTKSGFSVTFWLSGREAAEGGSSLARLRGRDVVLMQNVALNVFRKKVYGGSLRKDLTKVHLLYRGRKLDENDEVGYYSPADLARVAKDAGKHGHPQLEKTRRVSDWVLHFVGGDIGIDESKRSKVVKQKTKARGPAPRNWNQPPPLDSQ